MLGYLCGPLAGRILSPNRINIAHGDAEVNLTDSTDSTGVRHIFFKRRRAQAASGLARAGRPGVERPALGRDHLPSGSRRRCHSDHSYFENSLAEYRAVTGKDYSRPAYSFLADLGESHGRLAAIGEHIFGKRGL